MSVQRKQTDVAIIGAGFAGLGTGIELKNAGIRDFVIFEGEEGVGGSWRTNTYPGCACDVPSHLYSYSFEPNPNWPEAFSRQENIRQYIEHCADKYGMKPFIRFSTRVTDATFDETKGRWIITTSDGQITEARVLVPATGALSHPKYPDIKGISKFKGKAVHAARWDASIDLRGKKVAVIGSGGKSRSGRGRGQLQPPAGAAVGGDQPGAGRRRGRPDADEEDRDPSGLRRPPAGRQAAPAARPLSRLPRRADR